VPQKEIPQRACNEFLKVISEVNLLALPVMSPKWNYDREKMTFELRSQQQQNEHYNI